MTAGHKPPSGPNVQVWRVSPAGRVGAIASTILWAVLVIWITVGVKGGGGFLVLLWVILPLVALVARQWAFVPYVALTADEVVIQNGLELQSIPYTNIVDVKPGYSGILFTTKDDDIGIVASAVQKSNLKKWQHEHTRADDLVDAVKARIVNQSGLADTGTA